MKQTIQKGHLVMYSRAMVIVLIAMLLGIAVPVTGVELKVNGGFGHPGDRVSVAVDLAEGTGVAIVSFDLFYDSGALVLEEAKRTGLGESFDLADTTLAPGKFGASHLSVDGLSESSGIITSLTFLIKEGVSGDTDLRLMNIEVKDKDGIPLETVSLDGKIEIQSRPVIPAPVASFTADPTRGEAPMTVAFADESSGEIESLTWDFGDGLTSTDTAPLHTYEEAGIFIATLTATGPGGSDTAAQAIDVVPAGAVVLFEEDFEVDVSSRWAIRDEDGDGQSWYLDAEAAHSGTSGIRSYYNAAGNNDWLVSSSIDLPASGKITLSFWAKSGDAKFLESFDVKLSTTGRDGLADFQTILGSVVDAPAEWREYQYDLSAHAGRSVYVAIQHVSVDEHRLMVDDFRVVGTDGQASASPPVASFVAVPLAGDAPLVVNFTDASSGEITSRSWDFGDGATSAETNPSHTYSGAGTYTATLTVTGPGGSATHTQEIVVSAVVVPAPVASFVAAPLTGEAPLTVQFTDASSGEITSRSWDFGDGATSAETSPSHTYETAGEYTVTLMVSGPGGSVAITQEIAVAAAAIPAPTASFTTSATGGEAPLTVSFADASSGEITSRSWDFGDGSSSAETSPSHTYSAAGTYTVTLTVTGSGGSATHTQSIEVTAPVLVLTAFFTSSAISGDAPLAVDFTDASSGEITSRQWDFGDGGSSKEASPSHTYDVAGSYTVTLTVSGPGGSATHAQKVVASTAGEPVPVLILNVEYFIDQDPGFGQGVSVPVSAGADIIADFAVDLSGVEEGVHTLYVRARDAGGVWSLAQARPFFKQRVGGLDPRPHIAAIDYFFIDKEDGTRTQTFTYADFTPAPDLEADFSMDLAGLDGEYDLFVYARDEKNARSFGLIKPVTVEFIAAAPQAQNDTVRTVPDAAITIDVLANDFDPDGTPLQVIALTPPENGTATIVGDTLVVYTPDSGFEGEDTFSYTILDGHADTATGTATIKIKQPNRAPEVSSAVVDFALSPGIDSFTRNLDEEPAVFSDADGDALIYAATSADEAIVRVEVEGTTLTGTFITSGSAQIVVTATDEEGASASTAFNVEGTPAGPVSMDFDLADGDQEQRQTGGAAAGKVYELQFNVGDAPEISGWSATIEYDPEQLRYVSGSFQPGSFIPGLLGLVEEKEGSAGVGGTVLGSDQKNSGEGTLGIASFEVLEGFKDSTDLIITQISFRRTDGQEDKRTVHAAATIASAVPLVGDFSGDEKVDFADFFLFADHFGQAAGDSGFDGLYDLDGSGQVDFADFFLFADYFGTEARGKLVSLARQLLGLPESARLEQNFPNPFNASTTIRFTIPQSARVDLTVYNLSGQAVARLVSDFLEAGGYTWRWDGRDASGRELASGMYLYRLQAGVEVETRKLLMLK